MRASCKPTLTAILRERSKCVGSSTRAFERRVLVVGSYVVSTIFSQNAAHGSVYKRHARTADRSA
jgi:hypothetical protein